MLQVYLTLSVNSKGQSLLRCEIVLSAPVGSLLFPPSCCVCKSCSNLMKKHLFMVKQSYQDNGNQVPAGKRIYYLTSFMSPNVTEVEGSQNTEAFYNVTH